MKKAKIYKPTKTAMQSGMNNTKKWIIEFYTKKPGINPLMGWESSTDPLSEVKLEFTTKELAINYAKNNNLSFELVKNLKYEKMLEKLSTSKGLIFLPHAHDTCPRITIEAKLLDCDLVLGDNVLHKEEQWFKGTNEETVNYLLSNGQVFWRFLNER